MRLPYVGSALRCDNLMINVLGGGGGQAGEGGAGSGDRDLLAHDGTVRVEPNGLHLAALVHPDTPNDVAPAGFNRPAAFRTA